MRPPNQPQVGQHVPPRPNIEQPLHGRPLANSDPAGPAALTPSGRYPMQQPRTGPNVPAGNRNPSTNNPPASKPYVPGAPARKPR
jgi:hypothetical protein